MLVRNPLRRWALRLAVVAPLGALSVPLLSADDAPKPPEPAAIFKQLDKNGDGKVTRDEVPEDQIRFFERVLRTGDKDENGTLTQDEFVAGTADTERRDAPAGGPGGPGGRGPGEMFERLDTNKDGKIQKSEVPEPASRFLNPIFERLGKDEISREDFLEAGRRMMAEGGRPGGAGFGPMGPPGEMFDRMDRNGDGKVTKDEIPEPAQRFLNPLFERLGKNEITKAEFEEAGRQMRERMGGRPPEGRGPEGRRPEGGAGGNAGGNPEGRGRAEEMFKRLDKNSDGKLTLDEAPDEAKARVEGMLERMGKGKDGSISRDEFMSALERMMANGRGPEGRGRGPEGRGPEDRRPEGRGPDGPPQPREGDRGPEGRGRGPEGRGPEDRRPEGRGPDGPPPPREGDRGPEGRGRGPEGRGPDDRRPEGRGPDGPPPPREGDRGPEGRGRGPEGRSPDDRRPEGRGPDGPPPPREGDRGPEGRGPMGGFPFGRPGLPPGLARFDGNEDGRLSKNELERLIDKFTELDRNGDGQLDLPELMGGPPMGRPGFGGPGFGGRGPEGRGPEGRGPDGPPPREGDRGPEGRGPEGRRPEGPPRDGERRPEGRPGDDNRPPPPRDGERRDNERRDRPRPPAEE